jgi:hypothetical protein
MEGQPKVEVERSRSAPELIGATFSLYRRYSWLFLVLAGVVVIPYELLSLVRQSGGPLHGASRVFVDIALEVGDFALVIPLVSALHLFAVEDLREGREPELGPVFRRGVASLRVISPAVFLSWLGILAGFLALIVPGVFLAIRWAVVAQTGALDATSWRNALDRSAGLTEKHRAHVFWLFALLLLITSVPTAIHIVVFGSSVTLGSVVVSTLFDVVTSSFTALAIAFLYYDLMARFRSAPVISPAAPLPAPAPEPRSSSGRVVPPSGHPLDPASWSDEDRPCGWYVDPDAPWNMRFWAADGAGLWSKRTAKTPKATLAEWKDLRWTREQEDSSA